MQEQKIEMKTILFLLCSLKGAHGTEKLISNRNLNISFIFISIVA